MTKGKKSERATIRDELLQAGRVSSTATVMFHAAMAEKQGLSATEEKALELIDRFGPLTAGELAERAQLAPASVTGLVDRLERKGFARRVQDQEDKRRVRIELNYEKMQAFGPLFGDFVNQLNALYATYSVDELKAALRYVTDTTRLLQDFTAKLKGSSEP